MPIRVLIDKRTGFPSDAWIFSNPLQTSSRNKLKSSGSAKNPAPFFFVTTVPDGQPRFRLTVLYPYSASSSQTHRKSSAECVNLGWRDLNPQKILSELLDGMPVRSGNDANVAALGEMWQGGGKGCHDIVMVTLGTGVGGGVVHDQKIVAGRHGLGGEIGHIHIRDGEKETCNCGGHGCLEQVASATGIAREARRKMAAKPDASLMRAYGDAITAKNVLDAAKAGDALALEVMDTVCYYLGWALATISMTVDPEIFVIGGGVSKAGTFLTDWIDRYYRELTPISEHKGEVRLATLGNDAGIYGAARLILD